MATEQVTTAVRPVRPVAAHRGSTRISVIEPRRPGVFAALVELWRYRRLSLYFGRVYLRKHFMRTWLGMAWLPLRPALNVGLKLLVFGGLVGISVGKTPYPVFLLTATAAWMLFSESITYSTRSLWINRNQLRVVHVPRLVVIVGSVIPTLVDFAMGLSFAGAALLYYLAKAHTLYLTLTWRSPFYLLGGTVLLLLLGLGMGIATAVAGTRAKDIRYVLGYIVNFVYYLTPILYSFQQIPSKYRPLAEVNPVTGAMELFKAGIFPTDRPSPEALVISCLAVLLIWGPGVWWFHRQEIREW